MVEDNRRVRSQQEPKRRASKAVVVAPAAPQGLPALFERAALSIATVDDLKAFLALKREIEADDERRAFDQDFAQLQAEIGRVEATAYDTQKRRSYADLNALSRSRACFKSRQRTMRRLGKRRRTVGVRRPAATITCRFSSAPLSGLTIRRAMLRSNILLT